MRILTSFIVLAGTLALSAPALAITRQASPIPSDGRQVRIADPDERQEELANRTDRAAKRRAYDRTSARSVMDIGSRPR